MERKEEVRKLWSDGIPVKEIIQKTGTLRQTIWRWTRDLPEPSDRVKLTRRTPRQAQLREESRRAYAAGKSLDKITKELKTKRATVYGWIKDIVPKDANREENQGRRYKVNDQFFATPNVLNSYWAGMLAGDGNLIYGIIRLSLKDEEMLMKLKKDVKFLGKIREYKAPAGGLMYQIAVSSKQWIEDLERNFNIIPNKSHTFTPPDLDYPLNLAFLKGLYDADGCLTHSKKYPVWKVAGTRMTCEWVKTIANALVPENRSNVNVCRDTTYNFVLVGSRAVKMLKALHEIPTPELPRKWPQDVLTSPC